MAKQWAFETKAIHGLPSKEGKGGSTTVPIHMSAGFEYEKAEDLSDVFGGRKFGHIYSRISNPTLTELEKRITILEEGLGSVAVSSGLAAITAVVFALCESGDEILVSRSIFGGTFDLFQETVTRMGIKVQYVDPRDAADIKKKLRVSTRFVFLETMGNPKLDIPDFEGIIQAAHAKNVPVVADSTLTTPVLFSAKEVGVDIVIHSTTKYLTGSGSAIGGVVVDLGTFNWKSSKASSIQSMSQFGNFAFLALVRRHILHNVGASLSPQNAFLTMIGLDTLGLRVKRHSENALALAEALLAHPNVKTVNYPGLVYHPDHQRATQLYKGYYGGLLTLELASKEACFRCINALNLVRNIANLGDSKTLVIHPSSTIFRERSKEDAKDAGVTPQTLRVSVGLEDVEDIIADFDHALRSEK